MNFEKMVKSLLIEHLENFYAVEAFEDTYEDLGDSEAEQVEQIAEHFTEALINYLRGLK